MTTEQLQSFGDLVSDATPDPKHSHETKRITTRCSTDFIRTAGTKEEALLSVTVGGQHIALWLNPSEAMAVAASLVAQVMRIVNAKDAEQ